MTKFYYTDEKYFTLKDIRHKNNETNYSGEKDPFYSKRLYYFMRRHKDIKFKVYRMKTNVGDLIGFGFFSNNNIFVTARLTGIVCDNDRSFFCAGYDGGDYEKSL